MMFELKDDWKERLEILVAVLIIVVPAFCVYLFVANVAVAVKNTDKKVELIVLEDGTKCAIYSAYSKGGLSCNWSVKHD
jgi:hypothetical protein